MQRIPKRKEVGSSQVRRDKLRLFSGRRQDFHRDAAAHAGTHMPSDSSPLVDGGIALRIDHINDNPV